MSPVKKNTLGDGRRYYETDDGIFPSVTTVLSVLDKPALRNWIAKEERTLVTAVCADLYADLPLDCPRMSRPVFLATLERRIGKERAFQRTLARAATIGTEAHALIEWNIRRELGQVVDEQPRVSPAAAVAFAAYEQWRKEVRFKVKGVEQIVWSKAHGYAGTLDVWAEVDGLECVIDFKTSKAVYIEARLQVAAYAEALREMGHGNPTRGIVLRLPKTEADPGFEAVTIPDLSRYLGGFLHVLRAWHFLETENTDGRALLKQGA